MARKSITLVTVGPDAIRNAEQQVSRCEHCQEQEADIPFNWILADVLGKHGPYEFMLTEPGYCPHCKGKLTEKTLVERQGGIAAIESEMQEQ